MSGARFTGDFSTEPYWWAAAPRPARDDAAVPAHCDALIVGAGYTGLHAAIETARAGLDTVVVDAESAGYGCSSRNGGQVSTSVKGTFEELAARHGRKRAHALLAEGHAALEFLAHFIESEGIECDWQRCGRFHGAHRPGAYESMARGLESLPDGIRVEWHAVPRAEQHSEIGSDLYHGGVVFPAHASLHPARYHQGLLDRALAAGARVVGHCPASRIERDGAGFTVHTRRGPVRAGRVAVATNGYTGELTPWLRRRVIPIGSYLIATEPLDPDIAASVSPRNRVMSDSRRLVFYYRLSPDRRRMLFGGRVALRETDSRVSAPRLHAAMSRIFPSLATARVSHAWHGFVAYTFDTLPHAGEMEGVHYAAGYCGSGVSLASYCGMRLGQRLRGRPEGRTAFDEVPFETRPLYSGDPWFLAPSVLYYRLRDGLPF